MSTKSNDPASEKHELWHLVVYLFVQCVDLSGKAGRHQVHVGAAGQAYGVEVAYNAGRLVADDAASSAVDQQRCRASATISWAAYVVHLPMRTQLTS